MTPKVHHRNGCKCQPCRTYHSRASKRYELRQLKRSQGAKYDIDLIPADTAMRYVQEARARGLPYTEMIRLTGLSKEVLMPLAHGKRKRVQRKTEKSIMRGLAEPDVRDLTAKSLVPIRDERRIMRSLMAQGWSQEHLVHILQTNNRGNGYIISGLSHNLIEKAQLGNLQQIHWLAEVIGNRLGPSRRTMLIMQRKGVFPLKHYNEMGRLNVNSLTAEQRQWLQ